MKSFGQHFGMYVVRGLLAIIPLWLTFLACKFIYILVDKNITDMIDHYTGFRIPGLGLIVVIFILYFLGLLSSHVVGKRFFGFLEKISNRIPLVKTTYQVGQQVANAFSLPEKQVFKKAVLVDFLQKDSKAIGFITGVVEDQKRGKRLLKVFVPTTPNPTSGFLLVMEESDTIDPGWTVEEAMRAVISGGIIGPNTIEKIHRE